MIDSNDLPEEERLSQWTRMIRTSFYPMEADRPASMSSPFRGRIVSWTTGDTISNRHRSSPYRFRRTEKTIGERQVGMFTLGIPRRGKVEQEFANSPRLRLNAHEILLFDTDVPWELWSPLGYDNNSILVPRSRFDPYIGNTALLDPRVIGFDHGLHGMLFATLSAFLKLGELDGPVVEGAIQVFVHLVALAYGLHPEDDPSIGRSVDEARLVQATQFISANCHGPGLTARAVASHLGISTRRLHALYESNGGSVSRRILATRIERAKEMLLLHATRPVIEIAFACGFYSHSTFYRRFVEVTGITPGEFRRSMLQDDAPPDGP
ncbi:MAG: helix-turn-helix transcriptional regulator [Oricola sp.]